MLICASGRWMCNLQQSVRHFDEQFTKWLVQTAIEGEEMTVNLNTLPLAEREMPKKPEFTSTRNDWMYTCLIHHTSKQSRYFTLSSQCHAGAKMGLNGVSGGRGGKSRITTCCYSLIESEVDFGKTRRGRYRGSTIYEYSGQGCSSVRLPSMKDHSDR